jgi:hypothetical protein
MGGLVDSDAKAMGTYLALIYLLVKNPTFFAKPSGASIISEGDARRLYANYFAGRGAEVMEALEAGGAFVDRLFEYEDALDSFKRNRVLGEIEIEFLDAFTKAFKKYLRLDRIREELREKIREVLLDVRDRLYGDALTPVGTTALSANQLREGIKTYHEVGEGETDKLISHLRASGSLIELPAYPYDYALPAPCLSDEVIGLVAKPAIDVKKLIPPPPKPERFEVKPSREILEGIVSSVFEGLGFRTSTNVSKEARRGSPIEVDVWAERAVAGTRFSVYVSCKDWNRAVDRPVIDEESGRVLNLRDWPQMKVIVAKELTKPAKEAAEADGFIAVELGEKAEAGNARGIYELVYRALNEVFVSMAPPRLAEIAARIAYLRESLRKIEEELTSLQS